MEPVREPDHDGPGILRGMQDHLAEILGLLLLPAAQFQLGYFGEAVDDVRDLVAEFALDILDGDVGILDHIVQDTAGDHDRIEVQVGKDVGGRDTMIDEGVAGFAALPGMRHRGKPERPLDQLLIDMGIVKLYFFHELAELVHHLDQLDRLDGETGETRRAPWDILSAVFWPVAHTAVP
jgi:hypothetical protein